jgi:hypothetical protein
VHQAERAGGSRGDRTRGVVAERDARGRERAAGSEGGAEEGAAIIGGWLIGGWLIGGWLIGGELLVHVGRTEGCAAG